jgi:hypothetical protein
VGVAAGFCDLKGMLKALQRVDFIMVVDFDFIRAGPAVRGPAARSMHMADPLEIHIGRSQIPIPTPLPSPPLPAGTPPRSPRMSAVLDRSLAALAVEVELTRSRVSRGTRREVNFNSALLLPH